jgi:peptide/nickel transport system permease protein
MTDISTEIDPYAALQDKEPAKPPRNQWLDVWDQFKKHKGAVFGGGFLVFMERGPAETGYPQQRRTPTLDGALEQ